MITESTLYWITRLDNFQTLFIILGLLSLIGVLVCLLALTDYHYSKNDGVLIRRILFFCVPALLISIVGLLFLPTTKEMCAIKVVPAIAQNEKIQGIGEKALSLAEEWFEELRPKKKDEK